MLEMHCSDKSQDLFLLWVYNSAKIKNMSLKESYSPDFCSLRKVFPHEKEKLKSIPLPDLPLPEKRGRPLGKLKDTAGHELNHILTALAFGKDIEFSLHPESDSLAWTKVSGCNFSEFQVIAAGGSVETPNSPAEGYGSDMFQVGLIHQFANGMSSEDALRCARIKILQTPPDVRERAAEIMSFYMTGGTTLIQEIIKRALVELELEKEKGDYMHVFDEAGVYEKAFEIIEKEEKEPKDTSIITENKGDNLHRVTRTEKDNSGEFVPCLACQMKNGHNPLKHKNTEAILFIADLQTYYKSDRIPT